MKENKQTYLHILSQIHCQEKFEDTKGVIRSCEEEGQTTITRRKRKRTKRKTKIYRTLHKSLKIEEHEPQ